ncbi:MAG: hypothetical protein ACP5NK_05835 [Thermoplasmata archaeon]
MKEQLIESIVATASRSLLSGKMKVSLDRKPLVSMEFNIRSVQVTLEDRHNIQKLYHAIPKSEERFSTFKGFANILKKHDYLLQIRDGKDLLLELGSGVHSITGDMKVKVLKIRRYLKRE